MEGMSREGWGGRFKEFARKYDGERPKTGRKSTNGQRYQNPPVLEGRMIGKTSVDRCNKPDEKLWYAVKKPGFWCVVLPIG